MRRPGRCATPTGQTPRRERGNAVPDPTIIGRTPDQVKGTPVPQKRFATTRPAKSPRSTGSACSSPQRRAHCRPTRSPPPILYMGRRSIALTPYPPRLRPPTASWSIDGRHAAHEQGGRGCGSCRLPPGWVRGSVCGNCYAGVGGLAAIVQQEIFFMASPPLSVARIAKKNPGRRGEWAHHRLIRCNSRAHTR